jgi:branched-chain amino acid aminotransferase group I
VWVHVNGRLVEETEATVSVFGRGFLYGDGIFESLRAIGGGIFRLDRHLDRLRRSAARIALEGLPDGGRLGAAIRDLIARNRLVDARIRITVTRGSGRPGDYAGAAGDPTLVIYAAPFQPLDPAVRERGVAVTLSSVRQVPADVLDPAVKSISRLSAVLARREAVARGAFEAILLDAGGHLTEGTVSNLFLVDAGRIRTPPAPGVGLPGVTREAVLEIAAGAGLQASEEPLPVSALDSAGELFLTNTSWEVLPVTRVDGRPVGAGVPGPVTLRLARDFRDLMRRECVHA